MHPPRMLVQDIHDMLRKPDEALFIFDIDGTLTDGHWNKARASDELTDMINRLQERTNGGVAIITGRSYQNIVDFFDGKIDLNKMAVATTYGRELTVNGQKMHDHLPRLSHHFAERIRQHFESFKDIVAHALPGKDLSDHFDFQLKGDADGYHAIEIVHAGVPEDIRPSVIRSTLELYEEIQAVVPVKIVDGLSGAEILRECTLKDKGDAERAILNAPQHRDRTAVAYFGDTGSDVPAMHVTQELGGLAIAVGKDPKCLAAATHFVPSPHDLVQILREAIGAKSAIQKYIPIARPASEIGANLNYV